MTGRNRPALQASGRAATTPRAQAPVQAHEPARARARGKFLFEAGHKLYLKGVTYGTFAPRPDGSGFPAPRAVRRDLATMARSGVNALRTYVVPPRWLLDEAAEHDLRVLVGLPWEHHVAFMEDRARMRSIEERVRAGASACREHSAVLGYTVGNEIPGPIVRWTGRKRVERFLERLAGAVRNEDPDALVTYANYPTTEYLELPFLDFACFNVYLECPERLEAYLARLHNVAGDQPLVLGEIGLDSRRHGEIRQAEAIELQLRTGFAGGAAGAFVFAWTDEWHRGGHDVLDWDFGLVTRQRQPKPALATVQRAFAELPHATGAPAPRVSVVVCAYNAAPTIKDTLEGLARLRYPNFEAIVVDDGSTDATAEIASEYDVRVVRTANRGLSAARNTGIAHSSGEIVAFIDADAWPDPDWLTYLARSFSDQGWVGVGGPNLPPEGDGPVAECVANAPGGPVHVLVSDREAEHIPGCNMAFWRSALEEIGGFDERFRAAGDDVDLCWRLQERGWKLGFSPTALVWHHHRDSLKAYWRQQWGYGRAEALLESKWPEKYNSAGHVTWGGRVYGRALPSLLGWTSRVYHGTWGDAPFQKLHHEEPGLLLALASTPEWYLLIAVLTVLTGLGVLWAPLFTAAPFLALAMGALVVRALRASRRASFRRRGRSRVRRIALHAVTAALSLLQPMARLLGRLGQGLTPWRLRTPDTFRFPWPRTRTIWSEAWESVPGRLSGIEARLREAGGVVRRGGAYDDWDLELRGGMAGWARIRTCVEEHGDGRQLVRLRVAPGGSGPSLLCMLLLAALSSWAGAAGSWPAAALLLGSALLLAVRSVRECGMAVGVALAAFAGIAPSGDESTRAAATNGSRPSPVAAPRGELCGTERSRVPASDAAPERTPAVVLQGPVTAGGRP